MKNEKTRREKKDKVVFFNEIKEVDK